ncbi:MAG: hypothetical protein QW412_00075 [Candidatus Aenigmatarchaeota archaeon]
MMRYKDYGRKFKDIKKELGDEKLISKLRKLKEKGLVCYKGNKWLLSKEGKKFYKFLFKPTF